MPHSVSWEWAFQKNRHKHNYRHLNFQLIYLPRRILLFLFGQFEKKKKKTNTKIKKTNAFQCIMFVCSFVKLVFSKLLWQRLNFPMIVTIYNVATFVLFSFLLSFLKMNWSRLWMIRHDGWRCFAGPSKQKKKWDGEIPTSQDSVLDETKSSCFHQILLCKWFQQVWTSALRPYLTSAT